MVSEAGIDNCRIVGFLGMDKYEYIMYLSRVLYHLGKRVLLIDYSESGALSACIKLPDGVNNSILDYRGVGFLSRCSKENEGSESDKDFHIQSAPCDCILADYSFNLQDNNLANCSNLIFVTDQQSHNLKRISSAQYTGKKETLIIKDIINNRVSVKYITDMLNQCGHQFGRIYTAFLDDIDSACRINCQNDNRFHFRKLSRQTRNVIKGLVYELYPEIPEKTFHTAYKRAEKGE